MRRVKKFLLSLWDFRTELFLNLKLSFPVSKI